LIFFINRLGQRQDSWQRFSGDFSKCLGHFDSDDCPCSSALSLPSHRYLFLPGKGAEEQIILERSSRMGPKLLSSQMRFNGNFHVNCSGKRSTFGSENQLSELLYISNI
jgi:hypothetical protein